MFKSKKFVVSAIVEGAGFAPSYFSSRNAAIRFARKYFAWHGGSFFINGKCKFSEGNKKKEQAFYFPRGA